MCVFFFYSERERQKIIRRGQARRRNKRLCGQVCAHFKEVRRQTWRGQVPGRMEGAPPNNTVYSLPLSLSQERIGIKTRTSLPRLYTLHHLKSGPVTPTKWKHLNEAEEEAQGMKQRSPSANCSRAVFFVGIPSEPSRDTTFPLERDRSSLRLKTSNAVDPGSAQPAPPHPLRYPAVTPAGHGWTAVNGRKASQQVTHETTVPCLLININLRNNY